MSNIKKQQRRFDAAFKARVAPDALREQRTIRNNKGKTSRTLFLQTIAQLVSND